MAQWNADDVLDARGLSCPMPVLKAKKALKKLEAGKILQLMSTDPGTANDLPAFAKRSGDEFLGSEPADGFTNFYIRKG